MKDLNTILIPGPAYPALLEALDLPDGATLGDILAAIAALKKARKSGRPKHSLLTLITKEECESEHKERQSERFDTTDKERQSERFDANLA